MRAKLFVTAGLIGSLLFATPGCTDIQTVTVDSGCHWTKPIRPKPSDLDTMSDSLVEQILSHNETGIRRCRWQPNTQTQKGGP